MIPWAWNGVPEGAKYLPPRRSDGYKRWRCCSTMTKCVQGDRGLLYQGVAAPDSAVSPTVSLPKRPPRRLEHARALGFEIEFVGALKGSAFVLQKGRWVVERTFAWVRAAMIRLMLGRLA